MHFRMNNQPKEKQMNDITKPISDYWSDEANLLAEAQKYKAKDALLDHPSKDKIFAHMKPSTK